MPGVHKAGITADLAARLVAAQFPQWSGLPVRRGARAPRAVAVDGWDHTTFRLGEDMLVRSRPAR